MRRVGFRGVERAGGPRPRLQPLLEGGHPASGGAFRLRGGQLFRRLLTCHRLPARDLTGVLVGLAHISAGLGVGQVILLHLCESAHELTHRDDALLVRVQMCEEHARIRTTATQEGCHVGFEGLGGQELRRVVTLEAAGDGATILHQALNQLQEERIALQRRALHCGHEDHTRQHHHIRAVLHTSCGSHFCEELTRVPVAHREALQALLPLRNVDLLGVLLSGQLCPRLFQVRVLVLQALPERGN
mmetsp:Transcript_19414/g.41373  ORF Transcript_19414/g.41373 Transcript_19414/m.41373 type:complete len:245 (+) Transcript_19414:442-1176(+)